MTENEKQLKETERILKRLYQKGSIAPEAFTILNDRNKQAINYTHCCKSDSELLPDVEKKQLIEDAYWLNLQNLNGREDFEEAFKLGIETGVDETLEKLQS